MKTLLPLSALALLALVIAWRWRVDGSRTEIAIDPPRSTAAFEAPSLILESPSGPLAPRDQQPVEQPSAARDEPSSDIPAASPPDESLELEALMREASSVRDQLSEATRPLLRAEIDAGTAEYLGEEGTTYTGRDGDNEEIFNVSYVVGRGMFRPSLSRERHPDLYALKDRFVRLNALIERRKAEATAPR